MYFTFGEPIHTQQYKGREGELDVLEAVRDATRTAIESGLEELREVRSNDPMRFKSSAKTGAKYLAQMLGARKNHNKTQKQEEHAGAKL